MTKRTGNALSVILAVMFAVTSIGAHAESHVRIIRLSYIDGSVQMDRATGQGLERALLNTPITEGVRLATGSDGLAEVEFENNATVRVGENSEVLFRKLVINDYGARINEVELVKGTAYFDTKGNKDDVYRASIGEAVFQIQHDSEARLSDETGKPSIAVMKGKAEFETQPREVEISKHETLTVDPENSPGFLVTKAVDAAPLDRWNDERASYQQAYSYNNTGVSSGMNAYGYSDLNYYGGWSYLPGIGYGWQPYGVASWIGWNPYLAGAWAFYPGFGYTWASAYPWGWLPYHYGTWTFLGGGTGWFWVPGPGTFYRNSGWYYNGFRSAPVVYGPAGWQAPKPPAVAVSGNNSPTVKVGTIGNMPAAIPGGRVPPNFRSVVPGASITGTSALVRPGAVAPTVRQQAVFDRPALTPHQGHVFATPSHPTTAGGIPMSTSSGYGAAMGGAGATGGASHAMGPTGGSHGGSSGSSHGSGGHGSPR
jgi:hypothetical protein